jgi:hypothetical protein
LGRDTEALESLRNIIPGRSAVSLAAEPERRSAFGKEAGFPLFMPSFPEAPRVLSTLTQVKPNLLVEARYFLPRREPDDPKKEILGISGIFRAISSLAGIEYWSASRKKMWPFYKESYVVDSPETARRLPDPLVEGLPARDKAFAFQDDTTFGGNFYEYEFLSDGRSFALLGTNLSVLRYAFVPLIGKNKLRTLVLVLPLKEGILVYGLSAASAFLLPGMEARTLESLSNRADALFAWFAREMGVEIR